MGPYVDPSLPGDSGPHSSTPRDEVHSAICFQQLCLLFRIVTRTIHNFYVVGYRRSLVCQSPPDGQCPRRVES